MFSNMHSMEMSGKGHTRSTDSIEGTKGHILTMERGSFPTDDITARLNMLFFGVCVLIVARGGPAGGVGRD